APLPAALVRRARDAGVVPAGPLVLLFFPLIVGIVLTVVNLVLGVLVNLELPSFLFEGIAKLSAAVAWAMLLMLSFASAKENAPASNSRRPKNPAMPKSGMGKPVASNRAASDPVAEAQKAEARVQSLSDRLGKGLGIKLQPPSDQSATAQAAKDILSPLIDVISAQIAKYGHGIHVPPFDEMEIEIREAFEQGGWVPLNASKASRKFENLEIVRGLSKRRETLPNIAGKMKELGETTYLQTQLDTLIKKIAAADQSVQSDQFFEVPGLPGALGVLRRPARAYSTEIFAVELFLDEILEQSIWPLTRRPEIYLAFPERFELLNNELFFLKKSLRGVAPKHLRDGLTTEFLVSKPEARVRDVLVANNLTCPEGYLKFEMAVVMM
ncbi:hypothetical protein MWU76_17570, partial [Gelidibacter sp. F2691]|nr:hypothetical protein [Gelidibacter sp. F2691]